MDKSTTSPLIVPALGAVALDRTKLLAAVLVLAVSFLLLWSVTPRVAKAANLPELQGGIPILGNLLQLGLGDCQVRSLAEWAKTYGPVFQTRLGNKRLVFVNSFDAIREVFVKQHQALISRPTWHTFHGVASGGQDFTLGSSPWDDRIKRLRQIVAQDATRTAVQAHTTTIDPETADVIGRLFEAMQQQEQQKGDGTSLDGSVELDPAPLLREYSINMVLQLYLGLRLHHHRDADVLADLIGAERAMASMRSVAHNFQDYVPWLRLWPARDAHARAMNRLQDKFTDELLARFGRGMATGTTGKCVIGELVRDTAESATAPPSLGDIKIVVLSVVAASVLTVPGNLVMPVAWLACSERGRATQDAMHADILAAYGGDAAAAWRGVVVEERAPRLAAFVKESLRYWTVLPTALGRESAREVRLPGAGKGWGEREGEVVVPRGTEFHMNAWAGNTDPARFERPLVFDPERYLGRAETDLDHLSFGAGSRMCPGRHLGVRILYAMLGRMVLATHLGLPADAADAPDLDPFGCRLDKNGLALDPRPFKVAFAPRESFDTLRGEVVEAARAFRGDVAAA